MNCPKCGRDLRPWPLRRPGGCAPKHWVHCIRNDVELVAGFQPFGEDWEADERFA